MRRTEANARPARAAKKPLRFADEEEYRTEQPPGALRRLLRQQAEREQANDDDSAQPGVMTGTEFVAREKKAAEDAGMSRQREKAPKYESDAARPKKVALPPGWTPSSKKEVEEYLENLRYDELNAVMRLHFYAFFSGGGGFKGMGKDAAVKFIRKYGLVVGPWHKHGFPGMCNSEALGTQRFAKAAQEENDQRSDDATFDLLGRLGQPKDEQTHAASYHDHVGNDLLAAAFLRNEPMPKGKDANRKIQEWLPLEVDICVDCGRRRQLVRVEHANGGEHDGERRVPPCPEDNKGERAGCDVAIHAAHEEGETLTEDGYADILAVRLAYARPDDASAEDLAILAKAERLAAGAVAPEDQEALSYASTLRCRRICNDYGPTLEEARAAFEKKEAARVAEVRKEREAAGRHAGSGVRRVSLPPVRAGTRVVVVDPDDGRDLRASVQATMGARGVVRSTSGSFAWYHVELDGAPGTTKAYHRGELAIEKSRKPAARKPAAKRKPAARKSSTRKKSRK